MSKIIYLLTLFNLINADSCPTGWSLYNSNCYKLFNLDLTFAQAQAHCPTQQPTSYLAQMTSLDELKWLSSSIIPPTPQIDVYVSFCMLLYF